MADVVLEDIEWCDLWFQNAPDKTGLPRVLQIGDSISRGYYATVSAGLKGVAELDRIATSRSLNDPCFEKELRYVLTQYAYKLVHANNGLHGWGYTEEQYAAAFPQLLATLRQYAPKAKLIWATTTPVRQRDKLEQIDELTARVQERNRIAAELVKKAGVPTDDLYSVVEKHPEYYRTDGVHFHAQGVSVLADRVIDNVQKALKAKP